MRFDAKQFGQAIGLLVIGTLINLIPLFYGYMEAKSTDNTKDIELFTWIIENPEIHFLLLSTVFMSFMEYIIGCNYKNNGIIFGNMGYIVVEFAIWALWALREDIVAKILNELPFEYFFYSIIVVSIVFCLINTFVMSRSIDTNRVGTNIRQRVF